MSEISPAVERIMQDRPTGNWIALAGVIAYLFEIAVFIPAGVSLYVPPGTDVVAHYAARPTAFAVAAALLALLLMGRIAFTAGVRHALLSSVAVRPVTDLALAAMAVSVALEVGALGLAAGAARLASAGAERAAVVALDGAIAGLYLGVFPAFGLSVAAASAAMIWSGAFRLWLPVVGLISGGVMMASGIVDAALLRLAGPGGHHRAVGVDGRHDMDAGDGSNSPAAVESPFADPSRTRQGRAVSPKLQLAVIDEVWCPRFGGALRGSVLRAESARRVTVFGG